MPMNLGLGLGLGSRGDTFWWLSGSELDLDFANNRAFNRSTGFNGSPNGILTYTSPSPKMVYGADGVLRYAPHNLVLQSQTFNNASWSPGGGSVAANTASAPDGTTTADTYAEDSGTSRHAVLPASSITVTASATYTATVYAKYVDRQYLSLSFNYFSSADVYAAARFDLINGTVVSTAGGSSGGTVTSSSITDVGNGWYRCAVTGTIGANTTALLVISTASDETTWTAAARGAQSFAGTTKSVYLWGAQLNLGSSALTYIPTTSAAVYSLPIDHDPITHAPLGVLIEEQRTNLLLQSQTFATTWANQRGTVTSDAALGGDGTQTADAFVEDSASGSHQLYQTVTKAASSIQYALSVEVEPQNRTWCRLQASTGGEVNYASTWFNLSGSGSVGTSNTGGAGFTNNSSSITLLPNGRYKLVLVFTSDTHTSVTVGIRSAESDGSASYVGNSLTAFYLWGAQLEAGAFPTSYIPTVASQVTRAADQVSILTSAFGYNAGEGTLTVAGDVQGANAVDNRLAIIANASASERSIDILRDAATSKIQSVTVAALAITSECVPTNTNTIGQPMKVAGVYKQDDFAACLDGGTVATDTSGNVPAPGAATALYLGRYPTGIRYLNGHIKRLTYFPTRKTNAELQELSA